MRDILSKINEAQVALANAAEQTAMAVQTVDEIAHLVGCPENALDARNDSLPSPTDHRRAHRQGRTPKIDTDPELAAFIRARIDRLTFAEIADDVANSFEADRVVSKSTIWNWYQKTL